MNKLFFLKKKIFLDKYENEFIRFNKNLYQNNQCDSHKQILVELFDHPPLIYFWSIIVNYISKKNNLKIKYFYFKPYNSFISKFSFFINSLSKIYNSFNAIEGINEYNFFLFKNKELASTEFNKIKTKKQLEEFKYKGIRIGDLIYDTYIRTTLNPSVTLEDDRLFDIFYRAILIFDHVENYFKKNTVKLIITSHSYYIQHGIILRIGIKNNIPALMVNCKARGNTEFRLKTIDKKHPSEHNWGYLDYRNSFLKLKNKIKFLRIGKKLISDRILGNRKLSYLKYSPYKINNKNKYLPKILNKKRNIILFAHCFFDAVHRFRYSLFSDYLEQIIYFIKLSDENKKFNWFIKQHPNDLKHNDKIFKKILLKKKNVVLLNKNLANSLILEKFKPKLIITNNGTIAHEFAYFKIPVINTGDNVHVNYNFSLNPKNKEELLDMIFNIDKYKKKINFNKNYLYEFMYMHYEMPLQKNKEREFLKDNFFATKNFKFNRTSKIYKYFIKNHKKNIPFIDKYLSLFLKNNKKYLNFKF